MFVGILFFSLIGKFSLSSGLFSLTWDLFASDTNLLLCASDVIFPILSSDFEVREHE